MRREESRYVPDWLRLAAKDLERVERLLGISDTEAASSLVRY